MGVKRETSTGAPSSSLGWPLPVQVLLVAVFTLVAGAFVFLLFTAIISGPDWSLLYRPSEIDLDAENLYDVVRSTLGATGLVGAGIAAALIYRRQRTKESEHALALARHAIYQAENDRAAEAALRERFAQAVDQIGRTEHAVRVAGVLALAQVGDDWLTREGADDYAQSCVDVLCAYLRMPERREDAGHPDPGDIEVREAIVRTIAQRLKRRNHRGPTWSHLRFDLSGAVFSDGNYNFDGAAFDGPLIMTDCTIRGVARLRFKDARVRGLTNLSGVTVADAGFLRFERTRFFGRGTFNDITVSGGSLGFVGCKFHAKAVARFRRFKTSDGVVRFTNTTFTCRVTDFREAEFNGGWVTFLHSSIERGTLNLEKVVYGEDVLSFRDFSISDGVVFKGDRALLFERATVPDRMPHEPRYVP